MKKYISVNSDKARHTQHSDYKIIISVSIKFLIKEQEITKEVLDKVLELYENVGDSHNVILLKYCYNKSELELVLSVAPDTNLNKYINATKAASSRMLKKEFSFLANYSKVWERGFEAFSMRGK
jgi:hypothetical protein